MIMGIISLDSFRISLESFRSFRGTILHKPVTGQELFFAVSYSKPALEYQSGPASESTPKALKLDKVFFFGHFWSLQCYHLLNNYCQDFCSFLRKGQLFWEDRTNLHNLPLWKFLWPSQKSWTLLSHLVHFRLYIGNACCQKSSNSSVPLIELHLNNFQYPLINYLGPEIFSKILDLTVNLDWVQPKYDPYCTILQKIGLEPKLQL